MAGVTYDAAGNMTNDGSRTYTYDAEGRMLTTSGSSATYVYDAFGKRARATVSGTPTDFIYDLAGRVEDAVNSSSWLRGEIYVGGMHLATYNNTVNPTMTYFDHQDWAGWPSLPPGFVFLCPKTKSGCPILALFARVGSAAADSIISPSRAVCIVTTAPITCTLSRVPAIARSSYCLYDRGEPGTVRVNEGWGKISLRAWAA